MRVHPATKTHVSNIFQESSPLDPVPGLTVETPKRAALVGPRRRSPRLAREAKMQLTPSMSIPVTSGSRINKRERHRAATTEAPQTYLKKLSRKA